MTTSEFAPARSAEALAPPGCSRRRAALCCRALGKSHRGGARGRGVNATHLGGKRRARLAFLGWATGAVGSTFHARSGRLREARLAAVLRASHVDRARGLQQERVVVPERRAAGRDRSGGNRRRWFPALARRVRRKRMNSEWRR